MQQLAGLAGAASATVALAPGLALAADPPTGGSASPGTRDGAGGPAQVAAPTCISILGDSMIAGGFGLYLEQALEKNSGYRVARHGKSSTGLARPDFYNWIKVGQAQREQEQPQVVVAMFGGNDGQGLWMGKKADPKWIRYEEPGWTAEYRRRVNAFAQAVAPGGVQLVWIGMPVMRPTKLHARVAHMNDIYRAEMAVRERCHFIDIWPLLADDKGRYADSVTVDGKRVRVRASDGVHLSRSGAHHLVSQVAPQIARIAGPSGV